MPPDPMVCAPGESRACACANGATGAQVCSDDGDRLLACECRADDAGVVELDAQAGIDATITLPDSGPADGGRDATIVITIPDSGPRDAFAWDCSVVPQSGCPVGYACRLSHVGGRSPGNGAPECVRAGVRDERQSCTSGTADPDADNCQRGLFCWTTCRRYCEPFGEPCPAIEGTPQRCDWAAGSLLDPNPLGLGVCELDP